MQAMILAAGFGTRLLPYTQIRPKPLFPVLNQPLLLLTVARLKNAGFKTIIINCHHLKEQIVAAVKNIPGVVLQQEETILGTGGSLACAVRNLDNRPLLVTNGDIYHSIDFTTLYRHHLKAENDVTMVVHDDQRFNKIAVSGDRIVSFTADGRSSELLAYTGLQVVNPEILRILPPDEYSCIIALYRSLLKAGGIINCRLEKQINWTDMGTVDDYLQLHKGLLEGTIPRWPELDYRGISALLVDGEACVGNSSRFDEWVSVGNAKIGERVSVKRSVVWDGAEINNGCSISDSIVAPK